MSKRLIAVLSVIAIAIVLSTLHQLRPRIQQAIDVWRFKNAQCNERFEIAKRLFGGGGESQMIARAYYIDKLSSLTEEQQSFAASQLLTLDPEATYPLLSSHIQSLNLSITAYISIIIMANRSIVGRRDVAMVFEKGNSLAIGGILLAMCNSRCPVEVLEAFKLHIEACRMHKSDIVKDLSREAIVRLRLGQASNY